MGLDTRIPALVGKLVIDDASVGIERSSGALSRCTSPPSPSRRGYNWSRILMLVFLEARIVVYSLLLRRGVVYT